MFNKKTKKILKKQKTNSGFTLTELLVGLFMSIFVSGALGFGLMQIMQATAKEKAKSTARNEASRAVEFISDELRRASEIEPNADNADGVDGSGTLLFDNSGKTIVFALNIPEINDSANLGSDGNTNTSERIVYYLEDEDGSGIWQGPQVLYRWGPPLDARGNYTANNWQHEALIDGIDNTVITADPCTGGDTLNPPLTDSPSGFYACLNNATEATSAQIFLTGGIDTDSVAGNDDTYTAETRAVARAKEVSVSNAEAPPSRVNLFDPIDSSFACNSTTDTYWTMRTDFDNTNYDGFGDRPNRDNAVSWIYEKDRQSQPINVSTEADLIITSIPVEATDCLSTGNTGESVSTPLSNFVAADGTSNIDTDGDNVADTHSVSHVIQLQKTVVNRPGGDTNAEYWKTFNGDTTNDPSDAGNYNNPNVTADGTVQVLKNGSVLKPIIDDNGDRDITRINNIINAAGKEAPLYPGLDYDGDNISDAPSLGRRLYDKGYAELADSSDSFDSNDPNADPENGYKIVNLKDSERIIAFEIGQTDRSHRGFDMQDNVIVMDHKTFADNHSADANNSEESNNTGEAGNDTGSEANNYGNDYNSDYGDY